MRPNKLLKSIILLSLLVSTFSVIGCAEGQKVENISIENDKFSFTMTDMEGNVRNFEDLRGTAVILNVWATWCGPCVKEMPVINDLYKKYKDKGIEVWGVATDIQGREIVKPVIDKLEIEYPIFVYGQAEMTRVFDYIRGMPTTFFFDKTGEVIQRVDGEPFVDKASGETLEMWWEKKFISMTADSK